MAFFLFTFLLLVLVPFPFSLLFPPFPLFALLESKTLKFHLRGLGNRRELPRRSLERFPVQIKFSA